MDVANAGYIILCTMQLIATVASLAPYRSDNDSAAVPIPIPIPIVNGRAGVSAAAAGDVCNFLAARAAALTLGMAAVAFATRWCVK